MEHTARYPLQTYERPKSRQSSTTSAPIEIPSRGRFTSANGPLVNLPRTIVHSPELLFEMSPVEPESGIQSSPFRSLSVSISRWNDEELFSVPRKLSDTFTDRASSPQPELYVKPRHVQAPLSPKVVSSATEVGVDSDQMKTAQPPPVLTRATTPPIIRTSAVHKICGFQPDFPSSDFQSNVHHTSIPKHSPKPPLTPSNSSLSISLPWLLPGTKEGEDEDHYMSQSPTVFDFKKILLRRLEKRSSNTP
ncbi:hypothetical protein V5O48_005753 [Marasmius crinis-equi]|uniref:Uncharacterized protein n=1 Tax=Marasmius crinis-equi TaxID=585013 RepID=A0ABR3FM31_9AGAR